MYIHVVHIPYLLKSIGIARIRKEGGQCQSILLLFHGAQIIVDELL